MQVKTLQSSTRVSAYQTSQPKVTEPKTNDSTKGNSKAADQASQSVVYEKTTKPEKATSYDKKVQREVYLNRALEMKAQAEQRLVELFGKFSNDGVKEQANGVKDALSKILGNGSIETANITQEEIDAAKTSIAEGGYYSAEATSDRFIEFAKNISSNNPELADKLIEAFKEGYAQAEKMWGDELPEISQQTYDMTLEKFDAWKNGTENTETLA